MRNPIVARAVGLIVVVAIALVASGSGVAAVGPGEENGHAFAFEHAAVVTMSSEQVLPDHTVIVSGTRITSVGPSASAQVPAGAIRIDGRGKYLMPGLADMHVHIYDANDFKLMLASGVTTVLNMSGSPQVLGWRSAIGTGELLGPTVYTTGPMLRVDYDAPLDSQAVVKSPADAGDLVGAHASAGYDFVKVWSSFPRDSYDAILAAARARHVPVTGHVPEPVGLEHALKTGQTSIAHVEELWNKHFHRQFSETKLADAVRLAKEARADVTTTLVTYEAIVGASDENNATLLRRTERELLDPVRQVTWRSEFNRLHNQATGKADYFRSSLMHMQRIVRALHNGGVRLLAGTDAGEIPGLVPGVDLHRELELIVASGLSPYDALAAATRNPGDYLREKDRFGTISPGCRADLVLMDANPLASISNARRIAGVMVNGTWLPRPRLDSLVEELRKDSRKMGDFVDKALQGGAGAAKSYYDDQKRSDPSAFVFSETPAEMLAFLLLKKRKTEEALELLRLVAKEYPSSYLPHYIIARVSIDAGRKREAAAALTGMLARCPEHPEAGTLKTLVSSPD
jgi:imidazolonepropionase-like amidohydrolase